MIITIFQVSTNDNKTSIKGVFMPSYGAIEYRYFVFESQKLLIWIFYLSGFDGL